MGEFELIQRYFQHRLHRPEVALGNGDDAALLAPAPGQQLAISTDMLVEGRHFLSTVDPEALGHKALAVNLSDLAAMGAEPLAFTLALSLPEANPVWLQGFSQGLLALADAHQCALIGGDTTRGPLNICITVFGQVPAASALKRHAAQVGDDVWISGQLGEARLALEMIRGKLTLPPALWAHCRQRLERPTPRVALGQGLRGLAHAAADLSDGLCGDLGHILTASQVGAVLRGDKIAKCIATNPYISIDEAQFLHQFFLHSGDDYELVFTAPTAARAAILAAAQAAHTPVHRIGHLVPTPGLWWQADDHATPEPLKAQAFDHFAAPTKAAAPPFTPPITQVLP